MTADPANFDGQLIQIRASVLADGHHGAALIDERCQERGMALLYADGSRETQSIREFERAIFQAGLRGTLDKDVEGIFVGTFRWTPRRWWQRQRGFRDPWRSLEVREIKGLRVKAKPPPWKQPPKSPLQPTATAPPSS